MCFTQKTKGRKRHIATDIFGNILSAAVHAANVHGTKTGQAPVGIALEKYPTITGVCADSGYRGTFKETVEEWGIKVEISEKIKSKKWKILPKRLRVERTFARFSHSRRLSKDYALLVDTEENFCMISHLHTLLRKF